MKIRNPKPWICVIIFCFFAACTHHVEEEDYDRLLPDIYSIVDEEELEEVIAMLPHDSEVHLRHSYRWGFQFLKGRYREMISDARSVFRETDWSGEGKLKAYAGSYLAQAHLVLNEYDSVRYYLDSVMGYVQSENIKPMMLLLDNVSAIYAVQVEMDYAKALNHCNSALQFIRETDNISNQGVMLCNIAFIYYRREDPQGLTYAREAYMLGKEYEYVHLVASGARVMAPLLILNGEHEEALKYAQELLELSSQPPMDSYHTIANVIMGETFTAMGRYDEATPYYELASQLLQHEEDESTVMRYYLSYGNYLLETGDFLRATDLFSKGLNISFETNNIESRHHFLLGLSRAYTRAGDKDRALEYYKMYHNHYDSIQAIQREHEFNQLLIQNEKLNHENELREKELEVASVNRRIQTILWAFALALTGMAGVYFTYRKRYMMYRQLVQKHQKMVRMEESLDSGTRIKDPGDSTHGTEDPERALFERIEKLMREEFLYRDNHLSLEKIAEIMDSNRSYVSRVINIYSGTSFYNYINGHRIREAVKVLSDPDSDIPLKVLCLHLGFNALSAFYRWFQKETGVPPSRYRDEVRRMKNADPAIREDE